MDGVVVGANSAVVLGMIFFASWNQAHGFLVKDKISILSSIIKVFS